jgi:hypothetical protein
MNNGQLKREVQKTLGETLLPKTWSTHLSKMQNENYLLKEDTRERNKKVLYWLTEDAKQLRDLNLLRTEPEHLVFRQIYVNLFFRAIVEGNSYTGDDLDTILNEIRATRQELHIDHIKKGYSQSYAEKPQLTTVPERRLPVSLTTYYTPTSLGVKIIESTGYRENIMYGNRVEYTAYTYTLPGVAVEDLAEKYYTLKPRVADCERALELLLKRDLIRPIMEFRGKTRYVIADPALRDFVTDLYQFSEVENEFMNLKWQYSSHPTFDEEQSRRIWYSDESKSKKFFDVRELQRNQFRQAIKENKQLLKLPSELKENLQKFEDYRLNYISYMRKIHHTTITKYPFLHELIQLASPLLFKVT